MFGLVLTLSCMTVPLQSLYISGEMKGKYPIGGSKPSWKEHAKFLGKFGVKKGSPLYVYGNVSGNITSDPDPERSKMVLVVASESKWQNFVSASKNLILDSACNTTLLPLFHSTNESSCSATSNRYYRIVPCNNQTCPNSGQGRFPENSNFVFRPESTSTEFYIIFFMFCARNRSLPCEWVRSGKVDFSYSISVTTDPFAYHNPFMFQFPANLEGVLASYLFFFLLYVIVVPAHLFLNFRRCTKKQCQVHVLVWLFTLAMVMEGVSIFLGLIHYSVYSKDGRGVPAFFYIKDFCNLIGNWFLILVLILVAGGWQVTVKSIKWKCASFPVWALYIFFSVVYYIWEIVSPLHNARSA